MQNKGKRKSLPFLFSKVIKMKIIKSIINKVSRKQKPQFNGEWIEIRQSLDELDNLQLAEAAKSSL